MKLTTTAFVVVVLGASTLGQMVNPGQTISTVRNQLKSASSSSRQPEQPTSKPASQPRTSATPAKRATPTKSGAGQIEVKRGKAEAEKIEQGAEAKKDTTIHMRGKRDPFLSVIRTQSAGGGTCATGKKCLVIGDIALKGIVRSVSGMIAVVENAQRKTYFLHENDPVFNGQVVKIEPDAIVFRETVVDRAGRQSVREVVKRIPKPSIS